MGLIFPIARTRKQMKRFPTYGQGGGVQLVAAGQLLCCLHMAIDALLTWMQYCVVYLAAVLIYLTGEVLKHTGNVTKELGKRRINLRHMFFAVKKDSE